MIEERHVNAKQIKDKLQELQVSWDDLLNKCKTRKKNLDLSVQIQRVSRPVEQLQFLCMREKKGCHGSIQFCHKNLRLDKD